MRFFWKDGEINFKLNQWAIFMESNLMYHYWGIRRLSFVALGNRTRVLAQLVPHRFLPFLEV